MQKLFYAILPALLTMLFSIPVAAVESNITAFEEALGETGWSVYRTFSGDLVLTAPSEKRAIPIASKDINLETLGKKLEAAGWKVESKADGSLDLHPRETAKKEEASIREEAPTPSPADMQWEQMQQQLKAAGWDTSREADGSLVLIPPGEPVQAAAPEKMEAAAEKQADSMQTMQEKLKQSSWQVTENSDGSILFYPPKQQRSEKGTIQPVSGHAPPADFNLPVSSWSQARALTQKWLKQQAPGNLTVGKIREIYDVYLISILSNSRSDRLKHQIAIRKSDGHIIVLN